MTVTIFQHLGNSIENILSVFVNAKSAAMMSEVAPWLYSGLVMLFMIYGYTVIFGHIQEPTREFVWRCLKVAFFIGICWGASYQANIVEFFKGFETSMVSTLYGNNATDVYQMLDSAASAGVDIGSQAALEAGKGNLLTQTSYIIGFWWIALIVWGCTAVMTLLAFATIFCAKIGISLLLAVGPLFLMCLLFAPVRRFFDAWAGQIITYILQIAFTAVVMGLLLQVWNAAISNIDVKTTVSNQNMMFVSFEVLVISVCAVIITLQAKNLAGAIGGGVGMSSLSTMANAAASASGVGRVAMGGWRTAKRGYNLGKGAATKGAQAARTARNTVFNPRWRDTQMSRLRNNSISKA